MSAIMSNGSYKIWPADDKGEPTGDISKTTPDITDEKSVDIYFGLPQNVPQPPPKEQLELQQEIEKVLRAVQHIYAQPPDGQERKFKSKFRSYYVRIFRVAQLGLEGANASPEVAKLALVAISTNLVDDEAMQIKNGHLKRLGKAALLLSIPCLVLFVIMQMAVPEGPFGKILHLLHITPVVFANFMLLWVGCFTGVWLSYGVRTTQFTLSDLVKTDGDYLLPTFRLLFAGTIAMTLGLFFVTGAIKISIGSYSVTEISDNPMLAYLVGVFFGTSELLLPSIVAKRSAEFLSALK